MKERTQNLAIGFTVIIALGLLGWLIMSFSGHPTMFHRGYTVIISMNTTADVQDGSAIHVSGMSVGKVTHISFADPGDISKGVHIEVEIARKINLPVNTVAKIFKRNIIGSAYVQLQPDGPIPTDPTTGKQLFLSKHENPVIPGYVVTSENLIPEDMKDSLKNISDLAKTINTMLSGQPTVPADPTAATQPTGFTASLKNLDKTLTGMAEIFSNEENQKNIKTSLANLNEVTAQAKETMASIRDFAQEAQKAADAFAKASDNTSAKTDALIGKLIEDAQHASKLLATLTKVSQQLVSGKGSAGKLMNDPQLYNNLVTSTRQLSDLLQQLQNLAEQWRKEGVKLDM